MRRVSSFHTVTAQDGNSKGKTMYPTSEVRLNALIERHTERSRHRRMVTAALAARPARGERRVMQPSVRATAHQPAEAATQSS
jgi:hypothetical protein